jgi:hypothetical protein
MAEINLIPNTLPTPPNISELSRRSGYSRATVRQRLRQGWQISGEICRFTFLEIGVGFFVLLAFSAM